MSIICYITTALIIPVTSFLLWYFIYGRRTAIKEQRPDRRGIKVLSSAALALLTVIVITFDFYRALSFLVQYGNKDLMTSLFYPVSALIGLFVIIPPSVSSTKKDPVIPEDFAILSAFLFTLTINFLSLALIHDSTNIYATLCYLTTAVLSCLIAICTPLISQDRYNAELKLINSKLSDSKNAHYEAMIESNFELRRVRHDMKNHLLAIRNLAENSKREELLLYLDSISADIEKAASPYRSGNDVADAIIADKMSKASKRGITLEVTGDLTGLIIEPADLVTILSNLLDNAIEAVSKLYGSEGSEDKKKIDLEFKKNANFIFIAQRNLSLQNVNTALIKSSKNSPDHGFGIYNMKRSIKKYGGEYSMNCKESGGLFKVEVEIILPLTDKIN